MDKIAHGWLPEIEKALSLVEATVRDDGNAWDTHYFLEHRPRYIRTLERIIELCPRQGRILNIGSHYLHLSAALGLLGFESVGIDVAAFADQPLIKLRANRFQITNNTVEELSRGEFLTGDGDSFDLVIFTEILEHITFNPIRFWERIYVLLKPGGSIYITTPNSLTPWRMLHAMKRIFMWRGVGLSMSEIMQTVTYGHHWKEYSAAEVFEYFALLNTDFSVKLRFYNLPHSFEPASLGYSFKALVRRAVHWSCDFVPKFRDQIEAVVTVGSKSGWNIQPPDFI